MPFQSEAQMKYLYSQHPDVAKKFAEETPKSAYKDLPKKKKKGKGMMGSKP